MDDLAETTSQQQRGKPFEKGQSGNPNGRPRGSRHKTTLAMEMLLDGQGEALVQKAVQLALAGDSVALRLCLERLMPSRKDAPISLSLPKVNSIEDIATSMAAVVGAVGSGDLTPQEGQAVASLLEQQRKCVETTLLERKLEAFQSILMPRKKI